MLAGSLLLHLLLIALIWWPRSGSKPAETAAATSDVSVVFQSAASDKQASTATPNPAPTPTPAIGNQQASSPTPTPATDVPTQPQATQSQATQPQPVAPAPQPAPPEPQQEASLQPPQPEAPPTPPAPEPPTPPPPQAAPPVPAPPAPAAPAPSPPQAQKQPPTVTLDSSDEGELPMVPQFVMPQPPTPLPPLPPPPRPQSRPRALTQSVPRSSSGFPMPQNWSLATGPASLLSQHGTDVASRPRGSQSDGSVKIVGGTDPGEDWFAELRRWVENRVHYPEEAGDEGQEGATMVEVTIDHYGHVRHLELVDGSGYPLLDMAWMGVWRNAIAPAFPAGTPGDSVTLHYTLDYILYHSGRR